MKHDKLVRKWAERIELYDDRAEGYGDFAELIVRALEMQRENCAEATYDYTPGDWESPALFARRCPLITPEDLT